MARTIAKDHDAKRTRILTVAAGVFAQQGIARASMSEVARACGISKANIYHYYAGKDALIYGILEAYLTALRDRLLGLDLTGLAPPDQLHATTREVLLAYEGMDAEHKIQTEGLPLLPDDQQKALKAVQRDMVAHVSGILRACAPAQLADDARCRDVTMSVFGMLNWFFMWQPRATREDRIAYAATVADLTLDGVR